MGPGVLPERKSRVGHLRKRNHQRVSPLMISSMAASYANRVNEYVAGRPEYPSALLSDLPLADTIIELGAGTGKFTRLLALTGKRILAIEPIEAMAAHIRDDCLPGVELQIGAAEAIPVPDRAAGLVCCAQAFHWFDYERATGEILRVLDEDGALALVWNVRDERDPWVAAFWKLTDSYAGASPRYVSGHWRAILSDPRFEYLAGKTYPFVHSMARSGIVDRALSFSFIAALPLDEQENIRIRIIELLEKEPSLVGKDEIQFPYLTELYVFRKRS